MVKLFLIVFLVNTFIYANVLKKVEVKDSVLKITFSKELSKKDFRASAIKGSKLTRYFFDFKNCKLGKNVKREIKLNGDIKSVRVAQNRAKVVRLVIDSKKPYSIKYYQKNEPVLYINLPSKVSVKNDKKPVKNLFSKLKVEKEKKPKIEAKIIDTPYSVNLKKRYTIMLDPGHGGHDPGTTWGRYKEKYLVMQIAKRVYRRLKNLGFNVKMTRYKDRFIKLSHRTRKANRAHADLFVSIHANSVSNKRRINIARGIETYFLQTTRNARAIRIAAKENREVLKGKDFATRKVLLNAVFTGPKIMLSNRLAIDVQKGILSNLRGSYSGVKDNGVRGGPFYVLVGAEMPAILIETGYLSNPKERMRLFNAKYQELLAKGIVEGIVRYLKNREKELE